MEEGFQASHAYPIFKKVISYNKEEPIVLNTPYLKKVHNFFVITRSNVDRFNNIW